jgi:predicted permease
MPSIGRIIRKLRAVFSRSALDRAMDDEMRYHLECETADLIRAGVPPEQARRQAVLAFGAREAHKEEARDSRGIRAVHDGWQDLRYALRVLRRNPWFAITSVLTFALGIGSTTAIYSVIHGVLIRPLPYPEPDRLVAVWERNPSRGVEHNVVSVASFEEWRRRARSFTGLAALVPAPSTIVVGDLPEHVTALAVTPSYFRLLGVRPALGRDFADGEEADGGAPVVILSDGYWRRAFGADGAVIGRTVQVERVPHVVVGVMPAGFDPPRFGWITTQEFWVPFAGTESNRSWGRFLHVVGRLRPGATAGQAAQEVASIADGLAAELPGNTGWSASIGGLAEEIVGDVHHPLLILLVAVVLLLLMAMTNVASLTMALTRRREHELAVRRATGATRARLLRQLLTQSLVVGAVGTAAGVVGAGFGVRLLLALLPPDVPRTASIRLDGGVLLVAVLAAVAATLGFGVVAAFRGSRDPDPRRDLTGSRVTARFGGALVATEIGLGLVLSVLAGLMARSLVSLRAVDPGFDPSGVTAARVQLSGDRYRSPESQRAFFDDLAARVRAVPGVQAVSVMTTRPLGCCAPSTVVHRAGRPPAAGEASPTADIRYVDPVFFPALRVPLLAGRVFEPGDGIEGPPIVVVSDAMRRALWPSEDPVGQRVAIALYGGIEAEVIGVVGDVRWAGPRSRLRPTAYLSAASYPSEVRDLLIRAAGEADGVIPAVRAELAALDPTLPLFQVARLDQLAAASLARDRFSAILLAGFSIVALILAAVGIYGVYAEDVARRRRELGIRLALGSHPAGLIRLVVRRGLLHAAVGAVAGMLVALGLARLMAAQLYGVSPADPVSFASVTVILLGVALVATLVPALRAARGSPLDAIRLT